MSTFCSTISREEKEMIVGASINCSAVCGTERTVRGQREGVEILGTSITCSGTKESRAVRNDHIWLTICGTGTSRVGGPGVPLRPPPAAAPPTAVLVASPGEVASVPVGRSAARGPLPLWHWCLSSGPLGRRSQWARTNGAPL